MISTLSENDDIDFEPEEELGSVAALKAKLQKLRDELEEVKKERQEYLDGWQRCKADTINTKKEMAATLSRARVLGAEGLAEELIPALDSFDMAMQGEAWQKVDAAWRSGVESIYTQLLAAFRAHEIAVFGEKGETFDPEVHEAIQEIEGGEQNTIAQVLRKGYRTQDRIIRPAQVVIFK